LAGFPLFLLDNDTFSLSFSFEISISVQFSFAIPLSRGRKEARPIVISSLYWKWFV